MHPEGFDATNDDVEQLLAAQYEGELRDAVRQLLTEAGDARVQVAILRNSGGDHDRLLQQLDLARIDVRDVLAQAFYPDR